MCDNRPDCPNEVAGFLYLPFVGFILSCAECAGVDDIPPVEGIPDISDLEG